MTQIQLLSPSVVNKIAAGEVIERPASVVKELLENALDAGARAIEVAIGNGGTELIRITDDGHGIASDQLELAVTSHATSKIRSAEDLFHVGTLGFRGEALASIAEVSQMVLRSRAVNTEAGFELTIQGGQREPIAPCSCAQGTTVEVANLFYNTPVRRKFLRTPQTEMGHISEAFCRAALAAPHVAMRLVHNDRVIHDLAATETWSDRIEAFFGPDIGNALIPVSGDDGDVRVSGYVVDPSQSRGNNRMQYLFLNGRHIRDRSLQHALGEAYRGLLMTNRFPIAFLRLTMPAEGVDVNVHPAKLEVRFVDGGRLYSQLLGTIRQRFLTTDLTAREQLSRSGQHAPGSPSVDAGRQPELPSAEQVQSMLGLATTANTTSRDWRQDAAPFRPFPDGGVSPSPNPGNRPPLAGDFAAPVGPASSEATERMPSGTTERHDTGFPPDRRGPHSRALQIHNRYLVTESDEGVIVIDQHALHERIIYEQLREKVLGGKLESQQLLVPEPVPLAPQEVARVLANRDVLKQLGITVEEFGRDTILVSSYPAMLANHNPAEMLRGVVDLLLEESRKIDARDLVDELLHMISCKAAVKAGDQLSDDEIAALLEHRQLCQDAHHCPHGRPTALVFSREELDRRFKRI